jgi:hypothetical protein
MSLPFTPDQVTQALAARQVPTQCPRCTTPDAFDVADGFLRGDIVGGQNLTSAVLVCRRCGFVSLHSLAALGLSAY